MYLDNAASTPMLPEAVESMLPFLSDTFGNPSGNHVDSRAARKAVDDAREQIAGLLGVDMGELVFTGSGTEADNLAVAGRYTALAGAGPGVGPGAGPGAGPLVCSAMEHAAVLESCRAVAEQYGVDLREVRSDRQGVIDLECLTAACTDDVGYVSVMAVNNEIGSVQPLAEVAELVRTYAPRAVLHTDAIQAAPWLDLPTLTGVVDLMTISAHKFGGPKGIGVLVVGNGVKIGAVTHGGGQERERRSGTHNVAGIVATATALAITVERRTQEVERVADLADQLIDGVLGSIERVSLTGARSNSVPGIVHLQFSGVEGEELVILLDEAGLSVSAGAACSSGAVEPSHVLLSMGIDPVRARSGIRFSLGATTTTADIQRTIAIVPGVVARLRN